MGGRSAVRAECDGVDEGAKGAKEALPQALRWGMVWCQTILMTKNFVEDPVNGPRAAIVASGAVRNSSGPSTFVHTGNGIYEKTPRCPRGRSVHCRCFCTGTCSRPCHHRSCSRSHDGPGSSPGHQEGRQEENRPQGSLNQVCRAELPATGSSEPVPSQGLHWFKIAR